LRMRPEVDRTDSPFQAFSRFVFLPQPSPPYHPLDSQPSKAVTSKRLRLPD